MFELAYEDQNVRNQKDKNSSIYEFFITNFLNIEVLNIEGQGGLNKIWGSTHNSDFSFTFDLEKRYGYDKNAILKSFYVANEYMKTYTIDDIFLDFLNYDIFPIAENLRELSLDISFEKIIFSFSLPPFLETLKMSELDLLCPERLDGLEKLVILPNFYLDQYFIFGKNGYFLFQYFDCIPSNIEKLEIPLFDDWCNKNIDTYDMYAKLATILSQYYSLKFENIKLLGASEIFKKEIEYIYKIVKKCVFINYESSFQSKIDTYNWILGVEEKMKINEYNKFEISLMRNYLTKNYRCNGKFKNGKKCNRKIVEKCWCKLHNKI
ncbi:hypothetical protein CPAV1605_479 [seawater metagenome]|uniref:Uncharacterized protein n=1 Tax=seawater metagenome TaxID=1561972 RepID=A0A5E8CJE8_9ZZZZ